MIACCAFNDVVQMFNQEEQMWVASFMLRFTASGIAGTDAALKVCFNNAPRNCSVWYCSK
jgi:hypothetical protein